MTERDFLLRTQHLLEYAAREVQELSETIQSALGALDGHRLHASADSAASESVESTLTDPLQTCEYCGYASVKCRNVLWLQEKKCCPDCSCSNPEYHRGWQDGRRSATSASALTPRQVGALALLREYAETQPCDCIEDGTYTTSECSRCRVLRQAEAADKASDDLEDFGGRHIRPSVTERGTSGGGQR